MRIRLVSMLAIMTALLTLTFGGSAAAITNGAYDNNGHPYVAYIDNGVFACSGTLLSPTVLLTAAHCFSDGPSALGKNSVTGAPIVRASFDPDFLSKPASDRDWWYGSYYWDPDFGGGAGSAGFPTHDVAIVVFTQTGCSFPPERVGIKSCGPIPASATSGQYGSLPAEDIVDRLEQKTVVDIVGYGVQSFDNGGGPCEGPCKKSPGDSTTRFFAKTSLVASNDNLSDEFLKLHANKGGICFGDSGGPDLIGGTRVVVAVTSFGTNDVCSGVTYSYRVDTAQALDWITDTVLEEEASLLN